MDQTKKTLLFIEERKLELAELRKQPETNIDSISDTLNTIIEAKKLVKYHGYDSIYLDFKDFIQIYVQSTIMKDKDYDHINIDRIAIKVQFFESSSQVRLLELLKRTLKSHGFDQLAEDCNIHIDEAKLRHLQTQKGVLAFIKWFGIWSSYRLLNLAITLTGLFLIEFVVLLPAFTPKLALVRFSTIAVSDNFLFNHFNNTFLLNFGLDSGINIAPINGGGTWLMIIGKSFFIVVVLNFVVNRIIEKFDIRK